MFLILSVSGALGVLMETDLVNWGSAMFHEPWKTKTYPLYGAVPHVIYILAFLVSIFTAGNIKWLVWAASLNTVVWPIYGFATVLVWFNPKETSLANIIIVLYYLSNIFYGCYVVGVLTRLANKQKEKRLTQSEAVVTLVR